MDLQIITPDKELFNGQAKRVSVPGVDGSMGFLDHHAPLITVLKAGEVKVTLPEGKVETFSLKGGVVEVSKNKVIVLAE
ncbi:MAG TPA: ATP synthase F1 subunit epsilon [Flavobacteriales bacterium]|nr:ATP synthase F1 subunit epsilon [Flavobacteriales bacterium]HRN35948.1 ATP synthase F1 subunit epsilon [Flavobacteriales bacterium]HRO39272.1 ATP synthase F1 subunit epsilon [Flavobacteriales bacterium]HRP81510.1 ATP synthase F1 subunit epsilon [Flavobacteriales bacterium]HRQ85268.1 ATP synthase F1 subunit epsilon [Flavobacteriales bacterium]